MALRQILKDSHPVLRSPTDEVKKINKGVIRLLDDMVETMHEAKGVGLAANQVGVPKRILVALVMSEEGEAEKVIELINPICEEAEGEALGIEGCLSVPNQCGEIPRATKVAVRALNREGQEIYVKAEGLLARILQHEMDHLDGILITDKAVRIIDPEELQSEEQS